MKGSCTTITLSGSTSFVLLMVRVLSATSITAPKARRASTPRMASTCSLSATSRS
ncbi:hypothetical protein PR003_g8243 [Phytophthora rubi]|uniref:Uncharacterized protein n=1 Tax=Phytophthora rubi TaxID=129364 RepID=A0A6A4FK26_9STRA|nr:hypothetical protein PR003_g8243 [Phytophthora rubi]